MLKGRKEMYHSPDNDPHRGNNNQPQYPFNPPQPGPWQPSSPVLSQGSYPPFSQGGYPPPQPPIPGQFYSLPPQPPNNPPPPYKKGILLTLIGLYITFWFFAFVAGIFSPNGFAIFLGNLGISLFWGVLVSVLIMDWRGFLTINGWIQWQKGKAVKRILLGLLCLMVSPFLLGIYFVRVFRTQRRSPQLIAAGPVSLPSASKRPKVGIIVGAIVTLCALFIYTVGNTSGSGLKNTSISSSTIAPTATSVGVIHLTPVATKVLVKPTIAPTKAPTPTPTAVPTSIPTQPPVPTAPPAPQPTQPPITGVNGNPWGYNFQSGNLIYNPPSNFCAYFNCIPSFWKSTNGYVDECNDDTYSHSGGVSGACSRHGGEMRPLYSH
jgi:hypothetical protein